MEAGRLLSIAERLLVANDTGKSDRGTSSHVIDTERYTSLERHRAEVENIFHRESQLVGLSGDIAAPGAYITVDLGDLPVSSPAEPTVSRAPSSIRVATAAPSWFAAVVSRAGSSARITIGHTHRTVASLPCRRAIHSPTPRSTHAT